MQRSIFADADFKETIEMLGNQAILVQSKFFYGFFFASN